MSIEFALEFPCAVRQELPTIELMAMLKLRGGVEAAIALARKTEPGKPLAQISYQQLVTTPDGVHQAQRHAEVVLEQTKQVVSLSEHCRACPVNLDRAYGCAGVISYPISAALERWLMTLLPDEADAPRLIMLTKAISDMKYDGGPVDAIRRSNPKGFFEGSSAVRREWRAKGFLGRLRPPLVITSSQILQIMFFTGHIKPPHATALLLFLGLSNTPGFNRQDLKQLTTRAQAVPDAWNFLQFFDVLGSSVKHQVPVWISA